jgi:hypothetical protein
MNIAVGKPNFGRNNKAAFGAILVALGAAGVIVAAGVWGGSSTKSPTPAVEAPVAHSIDFTVDRPAPVHYYVIDSQAQLDGLLQAENEAAANPGSEADSGFGSVIDMRTAEGQQTYNELQAELLGASQLDPYFDASLVQIHDLRFSPTALPAASSDLPGASQATQVPTYFYIVETEEQRQSVMDGINAAENEAAASGLSGEYDVEFIDVSTLQGQNMLNVINGELFEMSASPSFNPSLVQIIDARE